MRVRFSARARRDHEDLYLYTLETWGGEQAEAYDQDLFDALARLESYPLLGKPIPELGVGLRGLRVNQHVIVYKVEDDQVLIVRMAYVRSRPITNLDR